MSEALIKELMDLGLNSYEAKVYLALLERDSLTVSEISRLSQVPRARAYDILENLLANGLAVLRPGRLKQYSAVDPDLFRERLLSQNEKRFGHLRKRIDEVSLTLKKKFDLSANSQGNSSSPLQYIQIIKEPYQIHKKFMELIGEAKHEILIFTKPPYAGPREVLEEQTEKQFEPLGKGITIKSINEIPSGADKEELEWWYNDIEATAKLGEQERVIKELPMKMVVIDERIVMLSLKDPLSTDTSFTAQVVEHPSLAKGLKILFETMWERAQDYQVFRAMLNNK